MRIFLRRLEQKHITLTASIWRQNLGLHQLLVDPSTPRRCAFVWRLLSTLEWKDFVLSCETSWVMIRYVGCAPLSLVTQWSILIVKLVCMVRWGSVWISSWYHLLVKLMLDYLVWRWYRVIFATLIGIQVLVNICGRPFNGIHARASFLLSEVVAFFTHFAKFGLLLLWEKCVCFFHGLTSALVCGSLRHV